MNTPFTSLSALFVTPLLLAILGFTYCVLLTGPDQIFNSLYNRLYDFFKVTKRLEEGRPRPALFKILIGCEKCFTGQLCAWLFLYMQAGNYAAIFRYHDWYMLPIMIILHAIFVALGIFYVTFINYTFKITQRHAD